MNETHLAELQAKLAQKVQIPPDNSGYRPRRGDVVFSLDAQYVEDRAYVALDAREWQSGVVGTFVGAANVDVPYVSQFFCFREGPPLLAMVKAAQERLSLQPDLIIVDGHGVAHPRRFGLACWVGVHADVPTIGCAKRTLMRYDGQIEKQRGSYLLVEDKNEVVGAVLTTQDNTRPVFTSPGHKVGLKVAIEIILELASRYRIPESLRRADQSARAYAKGRLLEGGVFLGELDADERDGS
ncbi:MAG: endonuclease V [Chloroflexi bacterium]|nr:endonuclease V [Chloroflexota bacterium]